MYDEETDWLAVIGELMSNGGDGSDHGSIARISVNRPTGTRILGGADPDDCRPSDLEFNGLVVPTGEAATAVANATLLPLAFFSGVFIVPSADAPAWLDTVANIFPLKHFVTPFVAAFNPETVGGGWEWASLAYMTLWGVVAVVFAIRWFKWEPPAGGGGRRSRRKNDPATA